MWCAYSAACAGITRSTELAIAPMVKVFRMSRRDMELVDMFSSYRLPFFA